MLWLTVLLLMPAIAAAQTYPTTLSNTASLTLPADTTDPNTSNNSATDQNALALQADLSLSKTLLSATPVAVGGGVRYQIAVSNLGPSRAPGVTLSDAVPAQLQNVTWTCAAGSVASTCGASSGSGSVSLQLDVGPADTVTVVVNATAPTTTPATIGANTASLSLPPTITDPDPGNNTSTSPPVPVTPASIVANDDSLGPVQGRAGSANAGNVLTNDTLAGASVSPGTVTLSLQTPPSTPRITLDTATGVISVAPGTAAGSYPLVYQICQTSDPSNCDTATATIVVAAATLVANNDTAGPVDAASGATAVINVLGNDALGGAAVNAAEVTLTSTPVGPVTINADGSVDVAPGAAANTYTLSYQLCEVLNPSNCASATVVVTVAATAPTINAVDDGGTVGGAAGGTAVANVLANDTLGGVPATTSSVVLTVQGGSNPNVVLDPATGAVTVAAGTAAGSYSVLYRICEAGAPTNCDDADVVVTVTAAVLVANDDAAGPVDAATGATALINVLDNDTADGAALTPGAVTLTSTPNGPVSINADGTLDVAAGAMPGTYTVSYAICEVLNPSNCASAQAVVTVAASPSALDAVDDAFTGLAGNASVGNVLVNDSLAGATPTASNAVLTQTSGGPAITIAPNGTVGIAAGTAPGTYTATYQLCEAAVPANCDPATVTVTVSAPPVTVHAVDDAVSSLAGNASAGNVLGNDSVDGVGATTANATLTQTGGGPAIAIAADGTIGVAAGTAAGTYTATYQLCAQASPTSCDTATVTVTVNTAPPAVDAVDDAYAVVAGGSASGSVLDNDTVGGATATTGNASLSQTGGQPAITLSADGTVSVAPGTSPGTYVASYSLCAQAAPTSCDTATVTVTVTAAPAVVDAVDDAFSATAGSSAGNVLGNDTVDGAAATTATVSVSQTTGGPALSIGANGVVTVAAGMTAGTYTASYRLCELAYPANCDTAAVTVTVVATVAPIDAVDDSFHIAAGAASAGSVLSNDEVGGSQATSLNVTLSQINGGPVLTINPGTGTVSVAAGTAAGNYTATYRICDIASPGDCDSATVTVTVPAPVLVVDAVHDVFSASAGSTAGNVLDNDTLDGTPATPGIVTLTQLGGTPAIVIAADGTVTVAAGTAAGSYTASYQLCETAMPTNCDTATITVNVSATVAIVANDDSYSSATTGTVGNVLDNDSVGGAVATTATVSLVQTTGAPVLSIAANGSVSVASGAPAGIYTATYRICDIDDPGNCDTAQVSVTLTTVAAVVDAVSDSYYVAAGTASIGNVLDNDTVDGVAASAATVSVTQLAGSPDLVIGSDGALALSNAAAGTYTASYRICLVSDPGHCDTASVQVTAAAAIVAADDAFAAAAGTANAGNVLDNDTLGGAPATTGTATVTQLGSGPAVLIAPDGTVSVTTGAAAGTYTATYQLCETAVPSNCDTASVSVVVSSASVVLAVDDTFSSVAGNASVGNVLGNDTVDGALATTTEVSVSQLSGSPQLTIDSSGVVGVAAGTAPGSYTATYRICLLSDASVCDTATVTVTVTAAVVPIDAVDDSFSASAGTANVGNVLGNDTVAGAPATPANATVVQQAGSPELLIAADGTVSVAGGTVTGTYSASYQLCSIAAPGDCDTASVTVSVTAIPVVAVDAVDDSYVVTTGATTVGNVLVNDAVDGAVASASSVDLTQTGGTPAISIAADGMVTLAPATPAGSYTATYRICEAGDPGNCDTATVAVTVNDVAPAIVAVDDGFSLAAGGTSAVSVLGNDSVGGVAATPTNVSFTQSSGGPTLTIAADGTVAVATGTAPGSYTATYQICAVASPTSCATATVTVTVTAAANPVLAQDDAFAATPGAPDAGNVLLNDTLGGVPATPATVTLTQLGGSPVVLIASDGTVSVAAGTAAGSYTATYRLCETASPSNCDTDTVTVTVNATAAAIGALDDSFSGSAGSPAIGNVLGNDQVDGAAATTATVTLTQLGGGPAIAIVTDGTVSIAGGTSTGTYTASYRICVTAQPTVCDTASVTVTVTVAQAVIVAVPDSFSATAGTANAGSVLVNDTVNGVPASPASVTLGQTGGAPAVSLAADGTVSVAAGTAPGSYPASYQICQVDAPTNCATTTVTVVVNATAPPVEAVDDAFSASAGTANAGNVLVNDTVAGATATSGTVSLSQLDGGPALLVAADGGVAVAAGVAAGTYTARYRICVTASPTECATATVTVNVGATPVVVDAGDDVLTSAPGNPNAGNVLTNDTLDGTPATPATVTLTQQGGGPTIALGADGTIAVAAGTPPGTYTATYTLCAASQPARCDTASVTVTVTASPVTVAAADDGFTVPPGSTTAGNVLGNDTVAGAAASPANAVLSQTGGGPVITLAPDGSVGIATGTAPGTYTARYTLCEAATPANCDTATVQVTVSAATVVANDDTGTPVTGASGGAAVANVLANDTLNGAAATLAMTTLTQVSSTSPGVTLVPATGAVNVAAGTASGSYTLVYRLCETATPANCDTAQVSVVVQAAALAANDDRVGPVNGAAGARDVINVLANDQFNAQPATTANVTLAPVSQGPLSIDANGLLDVAAGTAAGTYLITYRICSVTDPANCDTATATVTVQPALLQAVDDTAQTPQNTGQLIAVLGNDTRGGGALNASTVNITQVTRPGFGAAASNGQGGIVYTPQANYSGSDSFQYTVCETASPTNCATATVTITVLGNRITLNPDTAEATSAAAVESATSEPVLINVLGNDTTTGAPLDPVSLSLATPAQHGAVSCDASGCTYTANRGFVGTDRFTYRVCDRSTPTPRCGTAAVTIDVESPDFIVRLQLSVAKRMVSVGDVVRYTAVAENVGRTQHLDDEVIIVPPAGFTYVEGTMRLDGTLLSARQATAQAQAVRRSSPVAAAAPPTAADLPSPNARVTTSSPITISGVNFDPGQAVTFTYYLRIGAAVGTGVHVSQGVVREGPDGAEAQISNWASAEVEIEGEPQQEESLVLGSVFNDLDGNGVQSVGERGIAGVRIGSVEGLVTTTDGQGRFHMIGIDAGNALRGRNYILKVDAATLPPGTTFTTPNPRVRRITAGLPVRFDFGVRVPQRTAQQDPAMRQLTLSPALFDPTGQAEAAHAATWAEIAAQLRQSPADVTVVLDAGGAAPAVARALAAQAALRAAGADSDAVVVRDPQRGARVRLTDGQATLSETCFDGDALADDASALLRALGEALAEGRLTAVQASAVDPVHLQARQAALDAHLPQGPRVLPAAGRDVPAASTTGGTP